MCQPTLDAMYSASVVPRRSVDRIRRALRDGDDPEPHLLSIEDGMAQILALYKEATDRQPCPTCGKVRT